MVVAMWKTATAKMDNRIVPVLVRVIFVHLGGDLCNYVMSDVMSKQLAETSSIFKVFV